MKKEAFQGALCALQKSLRANLYLTHFYLINNPSREARKEYEFQSKVSEAYDVVFSDVSHVSEEDFQKIVGHEPGAKK